MNVEKWAESMGLDMSGIGLLALSFIIVAGLVGWHALTQYFDYKKTAKLSEEESKRLETVKNLAEKKVAQYAREAGNEAAYSFARAAKNAESLNYGFKHFGKKELESVQKRKVPTQIPYKEEIGSYQVLMVDCAKERLMSVQLVNLKTQELFRAAYVDFTQDSGSSFSNEELASDKSVREQLCLALGLEQPIKLQLSVGRKDGEIVKATILNILQSEQTG